jgi:hypothetical protein
VLQQLLKLYAPSVLASLLVQSSELQSEKPAEQPQAFFLIADADTVWLQASDRSRGCTDKGHCLTAERACVCATLQDVDFIAYEPNDDQGAGHWVALLSTYGLGDATGLRSEADLARYDDFVEAIVPGLTKRRRCVETAVVHHTVPLHLAPPLLFALRKTTAVNEWPVRFSSVRSWTRFSSASRAGVAKASLRQCSFGNTFER